MKVTVTDVDQRFSLKTQTFSNFIILELPSGKRFQVEADDEAVATIIAESQDQAPQMETVNTYTTAVVSVEPKKTESWAPSETNPFELVESDPEPQRTPVGEWPERQLEHHVEDGNVEWETLPDTQLPPTIKQVLRASGVPPILSMSELDQLKLTISEKMANRPKPGKVSWDTGPQRKISSVPRRSVSMDEAGNPVPPGGIIEMEAQTDPGEIREEEADDEVQQA